MSITEYLIVNIDVIVAIMKKIKKKEEGKKLFLI